MAWFRDELVFSSKCLFFLWRAAGNRFSLRARLKQGSNVVLRPKPFTDVATAHEIFVLKIYELPKEFANCSIRQIVDLGANVGYSCLWWLHKFPEACIMAYEPHPAHVKQIRANLQANSGQNRVTLIPKAASAQAGQMHLTDDEFCSTLLSSPSGNTIAVEVVDWLEEAKSRRIDLLKMDIEGGEYALLTDARFEQLDIQLLVLEWHNTGEYPDGKAWCTEKLKRLGYQVQSGLIDNADNGLLWAFYPRFDSKTAKRKFV